MVPVADLLKPMLESELETLQWISRWSRTCRPIGGAVGQMRHPQQVFGQRRDQGAGQQERPDESENDGFRQWPEQIADDAAKLEHRHENDADADQRVEGGNDDLLGPIEDGRFQRLALLQMPVDIFKRNGALIHQDSNRKRQPPSVITLIVSPSHDSAVSENRTASGIEITMMMVERQLPRNSRIISVVNAAAITPSRTTPETAALMKGD